MEKIQRLRRKIAEAQKVIDELAEAPLSPINDARHPEHKEFIQAFEDLGEYLSSLSNSLDYELKKSGKKY